MIGKGTPIFKKGVRRSGCQLLDVIPHRLTGGVFFGLGHAAVSSGFIGVAVDFGKSM